MAVTLRIPTPLRTLTGGADEISVEGTTVGAALDALEAAHPGIRERVLSEEGKVLRFVNIFLNDDDIRFLDGLESPVKAGDSVSIVPAIAGGR
jgi:molybdopterin synthase sulfur carrier subunit